MVLIRLKQSALLVILVGTELALEPEIGVLQQDTGVEEAGAADGELLEAGPAAGQSRGGGEEIGDDRGNSLCAFDFPASVAN